jgi:hypothetical protein
MTALCYENVRWLDVPVNDAFCMCCPECIGNLNCQFQHFVERERLARNTVLQGFAVEKLHRNELLAVLLADFVDGANVGMVESRGSLCFTLEATQSL